MKYYSEILNQLFDSTEELVTAEYNAKTRNVSYNAPNGLHDDICIAMMLAYDAYKNGKIIGNYNISVI